MTRPELKDLIEEKFGRKVKSKDDLEDLVVSIREKVGEEVDMKTLAEIFKIY